MSGDRTFSYGRNEGPIPRTGRYDLNHKTYEGSRRNWLQAWRDIPVQQRPACLLIQETHITTVEEAEDVKNMWESMWTTNNSGNRMAYWSISETKTGGVRIILFPNDLDEARPWHQKWWSKRVMGVQIRRRKIINIYAPVDTK
ncbi:hypothetical protein PsorP6_004855 [Peronosclerospora sorghi]|uniref:Uncharacterized protein n=1 Tax=Peronosclerospora sorghi TaxID=230839 RepID=A0ACC0W4I7_9STRA|nr:hypothetical protein PsorP6_004855 [Peronosclerospora sorghi]